MYSGAERQSTCHSSGYTLYFRACYKEIHPLTVVMKGKITYIDQNNFETRLYNIFSAVKLCILTWEVYGTDSLLDKWQF